MSKLGQAPPEPFVTPLSAYPMEASPWQEKVNYLESTVCCTNAGFLLSFFEVVLLKDVDVKLGFRSEALAVAPT